MSISQSVSYSALTLGVREGLSGQILGALAAFLRERHVLMLLDNCEHLLDACARLVDSLLRTCPRLTILTTSREPLGCDGEAVFPVPSLPFPESGQALSLENLAAFPSVRLFADRARMVAPHYQVTLDNAPSLARVCQRLDGIPLAIEMAAARIRSLSVEELAGRLDNAFRMLTLGRRTAVPRQQTLRATIDWSYELLNDDERLLLQRLSIFAGGCTLAAAEAVCAGDGLAASQVMDVLASLVAKSMVITERGPCAQRRYGLLEMVRQYSHEKLDAAGDCARVRQRHRRYFAEYVENVPAEVEAKEEARWVGRLAGEHDNLRLALEQSFEDNEDIDSGPQLVSAIWFRWPTHQEHFEWCQRAVAWCQDRPQVSAQVYANLLNVAAGAALLNNPETAIDWAQQAIDISRSLGPSGKETLMWGLLFLRWNYLDLGDLELALAPLAEAETIFGQLGPGKFSPGIFRRFQADLALTHAMAAQQQGRCPEAKRYASDSIQFYRANKMAWCSAKPHIIFGQVCLSLGAFAEAREHFLSAQSLADTQTPSGQSYQASATAWTGLAHFKQGEPGLAREYCLASIKLAKAIPDRNIVASCLGLMALIAAAQGEALRAAALSGASAALWKRQGRTPWEDSSLDTLFPGWPDRPDQAAIVEAFARGRAMDADEAVAYALGDSAPV